MVENRKTQLMEDVLTVEALSRGRREFQGWPINEPILPSLEI
jgi:hypothetical protein